MIKNYIKFKKILIKIRKYNSNIEDVENKIL